MFHLHFFFYNFIVFLFLEFKIFSKKKNIEFYMYNGVCCTYNTKNIGQNEHDRIRFSCHESNIQTLTYIYEVKVNYCRGFCVNMNLYMIYDVYKHFVLVGNRKIRMLAKLKIQFYTMGVTTPEHRAKRCKESRRITGNHENC